MDNSHYYDTHAQRYRAETQHVDISSLYDRFLPYIPEGGSILDAGCGSGRDLTYFASLGYRCRGFDASREMVEAASAYSGCAVYQGTFETFEEMGVYDAIWACASLLHVARHDLPEVFARLQRGLKKEGILYCSFKNRSEDFSDGGRSFTCFTPGTFSSFIGQETTLSIIDLFVSQDARHDRKNESWVNAVLHC